MGPGIVVGVLVACLVVFGLLEARSHRRRVSAIPIRIHVNGSRGKSTVTRLIAGALREAGLRVIAKTTGSAPRIIDETGEEIEIPRLCGANIREQMEILGIAAKRGAEAVVVECMAIVPEYQWVSENRMLKSTIGVITNVRDDHLDVMGPTPAHVARALCNTVPAKGTLITAEQRFLPVIRERAAARGCRVVTAAPEQMPDSFREMIPPLDFEEDYAMALAVCEELGVEPETAFRGMLKARPDPGAFQLYRLRDAGKDLLIANAFAANDPSSLEIILDKLKVKGVMDRPVVAILNNREDRVHRSLAFSEMLAGGSAALEATLLVLIGTVSGMVERRLRKSGFPPGKMMNLGGVTDAAAIMRGVASAAPDGSMVIGMGNIGGAGLKLTEYWKQRGEACG